MLETVTVLTAALPASSLNSNVCVPFFVKVKESPFIYVTDERLSFAVILALTLPFVHDVME